MGKRKRKSLKFINRFDAIDLTKASRVEMYEIYEKHHPVCVYFSCSQIGRTGAIWESTTEEGVYFKVTERNSNIFAFQ